MKHATPEPALTVPAAKPADRCETEADRIAGRMPLPARSGAAAPPVTAALAARLRTRAGKGVTLGGRETALARRVGTDLSDVRLHADTPAATLANTLRARAFTVGNDVYFARGAYRPDTPVGRGLLRHELAHVAQQRATGVAAIQRFPDPADIAHWEYEAERLTTSQLEEEIRNLRAYLTTLSPTEEDFERYSEQLSVYEAELMERNQARIASDETTAAVRRRSRARIRAGGVEAVDELRGMGETSGGVFALAFYHSFVSELPPGDVADAVVDLRNNESRYQLGVLAGLPVGVWNGLVGLIEGIGMLLSVASNFTPGSITRRITMELVEMGSDPEAYYARRRRDYQQVMAVQRALRQFGEEMRQDPTHFIQLSDDLGNALGEHFGREFTDSFIRASAFDKGYIVGDFLGMIVFEVLLELILAAVSGGAANLLRGGVVVGQGARAGARLVNTVRRILEASPGIRALLRSLHAGEEAVDAARTAKRVVGAVDDLPLSRADELMSRGAGGEVVDLAGYRARRRAAGPDDVEPISSELPEVWEVEDELPVAVGQTHFPSSTVDPDVPVASAGGGNPPQPPVRRRTSSTRPLEGAPEPDTVDLIDAGRPSRVSRDQVPRTDDPGVSPHHVIDGPDAEVIDLDVRRQRAAGVGLAESHHVATRYRQRFHQILESVDIDIDADVNRVLLEEHGQNRGWFRFNSTTGRYQKVMTGHHPDYHQWVLNNLLQARGNGLPRAQARQRVESALEQMKEIVVGNPEILQYGTRAFENSPSTLTITL